MPLSHLVESIKETLDQVDGYITGRLIVDLENRSIQLEQQINNRLNYIPLDALDKIEVRNNDYSYIPVTFEEAFSRIDSHVGCSIYAGLYSRVKKANLKGSLG